MRMSSLCHSNHKPCACSTFITSYIILKMIHVPQGSLSFSFFMSCCHLMAASSTFTLGVKKKEKNCSEASVCVEQAARSTKCFRVTKTLGNLS